MVLALKDNPILILGSARSGTTWVLDTLAEANSLKTVFEPLFPIASPNLSEYAYNFIDTNFEDDFLKLEFNKILKGNVNNLWTNYRVPPDKIFPPFNYLFSYDKLHAIYYNYKKLFRHLKKYGKVKDGRVIVKLIRANLMMEWILNNFSVKILFILRHPAAVFFSKQLINKRTGKTVWDYKPILNLYKKSHSLSKKFLYKHTSLLSKNLTETEGHTLLWCIENMYPLSFINNKNIIYAYYENLVTNPETEWKRIISFLGLEHEPSAAQHQAPSHEASVMFKGNGKFANHIGKWVEHLGLREKSEIQSILDQFGVSVYSSSNMLPSHAYFEQ